MQAGLQKAFELYSTVCSSCKAYKKFLYEQHIMPSQISTTENFTDLPLTNKHNYLETYAIEDRLYSDKEIADYYMVCFSSGSTGEPTSWPRDFEADKRVTELNKAMYQRLFDIESKKTLVVVTFGLGAWTAGMFTSKLCWETSPGHKLSVVTPGLDKVVAFNVIKALGKHYDQTIITGYPPFIVDLLEYGSLHKFDFSEINTKIHYTSARVSEKQRNSLVRRVSGTRSRYDVMGFYACSETGIIGIETREIVDVLEKAYRSKNLCEALFKDPNPPTLVEYNPEVKFLEEIDNHIIVTAKQPVPLIRYDMNDRGGLLSGTTINHILKEHGEKEISELNGKHYVYVHGRADAVRLLNNIYVDDVQYCLEMSVFANRFSGNFQYGLEDKGLKNRLNLVVYLKDGYEMTKLESRQFIREFYKHLMKVNPDFRMVQKGIKIERFRVEFPIEDPNWVKLGKFRHFI